MPPGEETAYDPYRCEYCGTWLPDKGLSFLEHVAESELCQHLWQDFREHAKREAGGT